MTATAAAHGYDLALQPTITCRHLETAWQEWRRAGARAFKPEELAAAEVKGLGPAMHCPACASVPTDAGTRLLSASMDIEALVESSVCAMVSCWNLLK